MRWLLFPLAIGVASPALAGDPIPLSPYDWHGDIAPHRPSPIAADHPLYHRIGVEPVLDLPNRVGSTFNLVARAKEVNAAISDTLARSNMLAQAGEKPTAILTTRWIAFNLPFKIGMSSSASATMRYELRRVDTGQVIFRRDVATQSSAHGGVASERARSTGRAAILGNLAGAIWCIDRAAYGQAPENCAAEARGGYATRTYVYVPPVR